MNTSSTRITTTFGRAILLLAFFVKAVSAQSAANWSRQIPQLWPPGRVNAAAAYDSAHGQVVLFGGYTAPPQTFFGDTWLWDGTSWTEETLATSPSAREGSSMAYDSAHGKVVLFGGSTTGTYLGGLNETWLWDGSSWTQATPAMSPPGRVGCSMAYDSAHGKVVLFGGYDTSNEILNDTWVWDGTNWTEETTASAPSPRTTAGMAYDAAHGKVVLFGGTFPLLANYSDTWTWDGATWTKQTPVTSPSARSLFGMAYDSVHSQVVLFGGDAGTLLPKLENDTWLWDGTNWTQASPQTSPQPRFAFPMTYDSTQDEMVLFSGEGASAVVYSDTWAWNGGPPPAPAVTAVVNGASFAGGGVVPGELATVFGTNLTSSSGINVTSGLPLPKAFLQDSVMANGQPVALFAVDNVNGQQQINFQVPWEVSSGSSATFAVTNSGNAGASISVPVLVAQPGIFNYSAGGDTFGAILHSNFQLANTAEPAKPGETVLIYCTGLGAVSSPPADGAPGNGETTMSAPTVMIGGKNAMVSFSGLAPGFVGLYQVNAEIPAGLASGNQPVTVEMAGVSSNSVSLPLQ